MKFNYKHMISFLWTRDIQRSERFYTAILGCTKTFESEGWLELSIPGTQNCYLALNQWKESANLPTQEFITLGVDDIDAFKKHLSAEEVSLKGSMIEFPDEGLRMLKFYDPDKNVITVSEVS